MAPASNKVLYPRNNTSNIRDIYRYRKAYYDEPPLLVSRRVVYTPVRIIRQWSGRVDMKRKPVRRLGIIWTLGGDPGWYTRGIGRVKRNGFLYTALVEQTRRILLIVSATRGVPRITPNTKSRHLRFRLLSIR